MKRGIVRDMFNAFKDQAGGSQIKAIDLTAQKIESLLSAEKITPADIRIDQLAHELIPNLEDLKSPEHTETLINAIATSGFPVISKIAINKEILKNYEQYVENVDVLVTELQATRTDIEFLAGFTDDTEEPELRKELMPYQETSFGEKDVQITMADFGRTISLSREALFNDQTGQILDQARKIGQKGGQHRAKMVIQSLEVLPRTAFKEASGASRAFVYKGTAYQQAAFYAASHASLDGRVNANLVANNGLSDYTNIQSALKKFTAMKTKNGESISVVPEMIIVHEDNAVLAWQILNSDTFTKVGQGKVADPVIYHNPNPFGPGGMRKFNVFTTRFLNSTTDWYIGSPREQLKWLWVYKPATASLANSAEKAFYNNILVTYKFSYHGGVGNTDYTNVVRNTA